MADQDDSLTRLDAEHQLVLMMIVGALENPERSVADIWHPPMTADGRQVKIVLELESLVRKVWLQSAPPKPPRFRAPYPSEDPDEHRRLENARADVLLEGRSRLRAALVQVQYSNAAFEVFPSSMHEDLRRIRDLLKEIGGDGFALSAEP